MSNTSNEGEVVKQLLKQKGMSVIEAAKKLGITRQGFYARLSKTPLEAYFLRDLEEKLNIFIPGRSKFNVAVPYKDLVESNYKLRAIVKMLTTEVAILISNAQSRDITEVLNELRQKTKLNQIDLKDQE